MIFEVGKTYRHNTGKRMTIIGRLKTHIYGECLVGECDTGELLPVGEFEENAVNWHECPYKESKDASTESEGERMTREEAIRELKIEFLGEYDRQREAKNLAIKELEQQPCEEYKRGWRDAIITALKETHNYYTEDGVFSAIQEESLIGVGMLMQEPKTDYKSFAEWVASEIFSNNWEYNKDSFEEIACRKLSKLGIVTKTNDEWVYEKKTEQEPKTDEIILSNKEYRKLLSDEYDHGYNKGYSEAQQPCDDWNAVLDELNRIGRNAFKDDTDYDNLFNLISGLPSAKQEPKTGHWIHTGGHNFHCSECDFVQHESMSEYKYCPNCGARMNEASE